MARRYVRPEHSQRADEMLNANTSLSGAGSAVAESDAVPDLTLDLDLAAFSGYLDISPSDPRSIPPYQNSSFSSYDPGDFVAASSTQAAYAISSIPSSSGSQPFANQSQYPSFNTNNTGPWNSVDATRPSQQAIPYHPKPEVGVAAPETPAKASGPSTNPYDSGYRSASQHDTQSHLSTPAVANMDPYFTDRQQLDYATLESPFQEQHDHQPYDIGYEAHQDAADSRPYDVNYQPQGIIPEHHTMDPVRQNLACSHCDHIAKTPSDLKKHANRHTKPFRCAETSCNRSHLGFATANDLYRHQKSVHGDHIENSKSYKCKAHGCRQPDKIWPRLDNFKSHVLRMHKCDKSEDTEDIIIASELPDDPTSTQSEDQHVINRVLHHQEDVARSEARQQQQSRRRASTTTSASVLSESRLKRRAEAEPSYSRPPQRQRAGGLALNTSLSVNSASDQVSTFVPPQRPISHRSATPLFGQGFQRQVHARLPASHRQSAPQMLAPEMARAHSQQDAYRRRNTVNQFNQSQHFHQQYSHPVFTLSPTQPEPAIPEEAQSAIDFSYQQPQSQSHFMSQIMNQYGAHTVIGNYDYDRAQMDGSDFAAHQSAQPVVDMPRAVEMLGGMQPEFQQASVSPTITGNNPPTPLPTTPLSQTPTFMLTTAGTVLPDDISDPETINNFLQSHDHYKSLRQIASTDCGREEITRLIREVKGSTASIKPETSYSHSMDPSSAAPTPQPQSHQHHYRQPSSSSATTTFSTAAAATYATPSHQPAIKSISSPAPSGLVAAASAKPISATKTAVRRSADGKVNAICPECGKAVGRGSDLKKHMKRHDRPYGCVRDGCSKAFGSKNDWKRHEPRHGEFVGGWRCDGGHGQEEEGCQKWFPLSSMSAASSSSASAATTANYDGGSARYRTHLLAAGVPAFEVDAVATSCFIPAGNKGAFWCGFCDEVVILSAIREGEAEGDREKKWADERLSHVDAHYMVDYPAKRNTEWKDCAGEGRRKADYADGEGL